MLRWMTPFLVAIFAIGTAAAESPGATKTADGPAAAKPADSPAAAKPADSPARHQAGRQARRSAAKRAAARRAAVRAAGQLPPGLPRAHYKYRTTVAPAAAPLYVRRGRALVVEEEVLTLLFTPVERRCPMRRASSARRCCRAPRRCPAITARSHSYSYDGPYYGGPLRPLLEPPALRLRRVRILLNAH